MKRITVIASVMCPTHQQLIGYLEARNWHMVTRREHSEGLIYSRWQKDGQHYFVDIHESPEFPEYYFRQKDAIILLALYDKWLDEYSLIQQLLRGGVIGQDSNMSLHDKAKMISSDRGMDDDFSPSNMGGKRQVLRSSRRTQ